MLTGGTQSHNPPESQMTIAFSATLTVPLTKTKPLGKRLRLIQIELYFQDCTNAKRSALSRSLCVSVMPCGAPS